MTATTPVRIPETPTATTAAIKAVANAIASGLVSENVIDSNNEAANLVDVGKYVADSGFAIARALNRLADAHQKLADDAARRTDAVEALVGLLSDRTPSKLKIAK